MFKYQICINCEKLSLKAAHLQVWHNFISFDIKDLCNYGNRNIDYIAK